MIRINKIEQEKDLLWKQMQKIREELKSMEVGFPAPGEPDRAEMNEKWRKLKREEKRLHCKVKRLEKARLQEAGLLPEAVNGELSRALSKYFC